MLSGFSDKAGASARRLQSFQRARRDLVTPTIQRVPSLSFKNGDQQSISPVPLVGQTADSHESSGARSCDLSAWTWKDGPSSSSPPWKPEAVDRTCGIHVHVQGHNPQLENTLKNVELRRCAASQREALLRWRRTTHVLSKFVAMSKRRKSIRRRTFFRVWVSESACGSANFRVDGRKKRELRSLSYTSTDTSHRPRSSASAHSQRVEELRSQIADALAARGLPPSLGVESLVVFDQKRLASHKAQHQQLHLSPAFQPHQFASASLARERTSQLAAQEARRDCRELWRARQRRRNEQCCLKALLSWQAEALEAQAGWELGRAVRERLLEGVILGWKSVTLLADMQRHWDEERALRIMGRFVTELKRRVWVRRGVVAAGDRRRRRIAGVVLERLRGAAAVAGARRETVWEIEEREEESQKTRALRAWQWWARVTVRVDRRYQQRVSARLRPCTHRQDRHTHTHNTHITHTHTHTHFTQTHTHIVGPSPVLM